MSHYDYRISRELVLRELPFDALMMAAMARADDQNAGVLQRAFPDLWAELRERYRAPGGLLIIDVAAAGDLVAASPEQRVSPGKRDWCDVCSGRIVLDDHGEWAHVDARYHLPKPGGAALIGRPDLSDTNGGPPP